MKRTPQCCNNSKVTNIMYTVSDRHVFVLLLLIWRGRGDDCPTNPLIFTFPFSNQVSFLSFCLSVLVPSHHRSPPSSSPLCFSFQTCNHHQQQQKSVILSEFFLIFPLKQGKYRMSALLSFKPKINRRRPFWQSCFVASCVFSMLITPHQLIF